MLTVRFSTRPLGAGEYIEHQFPAVLRHPGLMRLVTRSVAAGIGTPSRQAIPPHRLLQPVQGGFVRVEPTAATRDFGFEGTRWEFGAANATLVLGAGGTLLQAGGPGGHWQVVDDVLQLALTDGARYALTLRAEVAAARGTGEQGPG